MQSMFHPRRARAFFHLLKLDVSCLMLNLLSLPDLAQFLGFHGRNPPQFLCSFSQFYQLLPT